MAISGGDGSIVLTTKVDDAGLKKGTKSLRSEAMKLAAEYRKAGMSQSEAQKRAYKELGITAKETDKVTKKTKEFGNESEKSGSKASRAYGGVKSAISAIGRAFAVVGVAGLTAFAGITKAAVDSYAEYEQLKGGVETLFKDSANTLMKYADEAYKTAGMSANQYMEGVTSFSASMIASVGGDTAKAAELSNQAMISISDNANKMGTDMESIIMTYQSLARGNVGMLDNLKLGYGGTKAELERLIADAEEYKKSMGEIVDYDASNFADVTQAIQAIQEKLGIAGATAQEASTTIQGSAMAMKAAWQNLLTGMADPTQDFDALLQNFISSIGTFAGNLLPVIQTATQGVLQMIQGLLPELGSMVSEMLPIVVEGASGIISGIVSAAPMVVQAISGLLPELLTALGGIIGEVANQLPSVMQTLVSALPSVIESIVSVLPTLIPQVVSGISQAVTLLANNASSIIEPLISALPDLLISIIDAIMSNLPLVIEGTISLVMALVSAIPEIIDGIVQALPTVISLVISGLLKCLPQILAGLGMIVIGIVRSLPSIFGSLIEGVGNIFVGIWDGIKEAFAPVGEWFSEKFSEAWEAIKNAWSSVVDWFSGIWDSICSVFASVGGWFKTKFDEAVTGIKNAWSSVVNWFSDIWNSITGVFASVGGWFRNKFNEAVTGIKNAWSSVVGWFSGIWSSITGVFASVGSWFKTKFNEAVNGIKNAWSSVVGWFSSIWNSIMGVFASVGGWFRNKFNEAVSGIKNAWSSIKSFFTSKWNEITGVFQNAKAKFLSIGKNIVDGIKQGIANAWGNLKSWFTGLFGDLKSIAKNILGIASPSKYFIWIAQMIVAGLTKGIDKYGKLAVRGVKELGMDVVDVFSDIIPEIADNLLKDHRSEVQKVVDESNEELLESERFYAEESLRIEREKEEQEYQEKLDNAKKELKKDKENAEKQLAEKKKNAKTSNDISEAKAEYEEKISEANAKYEEEIQKIHNDKIQKEQEKANKEYLDELKETADKERKIYEARIKDVENLKKTIVNAYSDMASEALDSISELQKTQESFAEKLAGYGDLTYEKKYTNKYGMKVTENWLSDLSDQTEFLEEYYDMLMAVKDRGNVPKEFFSVIRDMGLEEGLEYANSLLELSDEDFANYIREWEHKQETAKNISKALYEDEATELATSINDEFDSLKDDMFGIGKDSASEFGDGFIQQLKFLAHDIRYALQSALGGVTIGGIGPVISGDGDIIKVPALARGGIAPRKMLAMIGERGREAVLPLENNTGWMDALADRISARMSGASSTVVLEVDGREFGRAVVEQGNRENRRIGTRLVSR